MCYPTLHILWPIDEGNEGFILGRKHSATLVVIGIGAFLNVRDSLSGVNFSDSGHF